MALLDDIGDYLSTNGVGTIWTNLFKGYMPETPNAAVAVYETGGLGPARVACGGPGRPAARMPRVQIVSRSTSYPVAEQKAQDCYALLEGLGDRTINATTYHWIGAVQEPFLMGREEGGRVLIACNFDIVRST